MLSEPHSALDIRLNAAGNTKLKNPRYLDNIQPGRMNKMLVTSTVMLLEKLRIMIHALIKYKIYHSVQKMSPENNSEP